MAVKNYVYSVRRVEGKDQLEEIFRKANKYRNKICELELERRKKVYAELKKFSPEFAECAHTIDELDASLEEARSKIKQLRAKTRSRKPEGISELRQQCTNIIAHLKDQRKKYKEFKKIAFESSDLQSRLKVVDAEYKKGVKKARAEADLFWATKGQVEANCRSFSKGPPPRFRRYDKEGTAAVQFQKGLPSNKFDEKNLICYLDQSSKNGKLIDCYFRIDSVSRKPVFVKATVVLHRPLADGVVKWAYLSKTLLADHERWQLRAVIDMPDVIPEVDASKWVAVHYGWLSTDSGLRSVTWRGFDGKSGELVLPNWHCNQYGRLDQIRSDQDMQLNLIKEVFKNWSANRPVPDWMVPAKKHGQKWRSMQRWRDFMAYWNKNSVPGEQSVHNVPSDPETFNRYAASGKLKRDPVAELEKRGFKCKLVSDHKSSRYYRATNYEKTAKTYYIRVSNHSRVQIKDDYAMYYDIVSETALELFLMLVDQDKIEIPVVDAMNLICDRETRLWRHSCRLAKRITRRRADWYRNFAKELRDNYDVVLYSKFGVADMTKKLKPEDVNEHNSAAVRRSSWAATSTLSGYMIENFAFAHVAVPSKNLTRECASCGTVSKGENRTVQCVHCGKTFNVDENALENTIKRGQKLLSEGALGDLVAKHEASKQQAKEKRKKMLDARRKQREKEKAEASAT